MEAKAVITKRLLRPQRRTAEQIRDMVAAHIAEQGLQVGDRIPSESELCEAFGVSRPTVREALRLLEQERLIVTEHGRGRFVTAFAALKVPRPITAFESITEMLSALGYSPATRVLSADVVSAGAQPEAQAALCLDAADQVLVLERQRTEEGRVLVYSIDVVPRALLPEDLRPEACTGSINALLAAGGHRPVMSRANVAATALPDGLLPASESEGPWLLVTETCFSVAGTPVLFARDYHRGSEISFNFTRQ